ncbi:MAG: hypothetical protein WDM87_13355 [Terracidiphilus sp.]
MEYQKAASALTAERKTAAAKLAKLAEAQINSLAMKVKFEVAVTSNESSTPTESSTTAASGQHEVSGHDFSRAEKGVKNKGALAPEGERVRKLPLDRRRLGRGRIPHLDQPRRAAQATG